MRQWWAVPEAAALVVPAAPGLVFTPPVKWVHDDSVPRLRRQESHHWLSPAVAANIARTVLRGV